MEGSIMPQNFRAFGVGVEDACSSARHGPINRTPIEWLCLSFSTPSNYRGVPISLFNSPFVGNK